MVVGLVGEVGRSVVTVCERVPVVVLDWGLSAEGYSEEGMVREVALMADAPGLLVLSQTGQGGR